MKSLCLCTEFKAVIGCNSLSRHILVSSQSIDCFFVTTPDDIHYAANSKIVKLGLELIKKGKKEEATTLNAHCELCHFKEHEASLLLPNPRLTNIWGIKFSGL